MKKLNLVSHVAILLIVTVLCGLVYAAVQQAHRSMANDPQLQIALDLKNAIENNPQSAQAVTDDHLDLSRTLSVFRALYDRNGLPLVSSGRLNGEWPRMPKGVLDFTKNHGEDVVTWQPAAGVRMAMVIEAVNSSQVGFVAVGRSLRIIEKREASLTTLVSIAWLVCVGIVLLHGLFSWFTSKD